MLDAYEKLFELIDKEIFFKSSINKYYGSRLADLHLILPNEVPQLSC